MTRPHATDRPRNRIVKPRSVWFLGSLIALLSWTTVSGATPPCEPTGERYAVRILPVSVDGQAPGPHPEIWGRRVFEQVVEGRWLFQLVPQPHGWSIRILDYPVEGEPVELSVITPPHGGVPNPREISGWHFRNADNTGPNLGDVNAPQHDRLFFFARSAAEAGRFAPSTDPSAPRWQSPTPDQGVGWLRIVDYGLSDLEPGERARMTYLQFEACLTWPKSDDQRHREADAASREFIPEEVETFGACGLDLSAFALDAAVLPRMLGGDLDGDGALDEVAQIRRRSDGKRGLAVCRAGTWIHLIDTVAPEGEDMRPGFAGSAGEGLRPGFIDQMEAWRRVEKDHGPLGYVGEPPWPEAEGDLLLLERIEKEAVLIFWKNGAFRSQQVYRYVEP